jgi:proteic killer suppression protein
MIISFASKEEEKIFKGECSKNFPDQIQHRAMRKLWMLDAAVSINDLRVPPANHLEKLSGDKQGQYTIRIND